MERSNFHQRLVRSGEEFALPHAGHAILYLYQEAENRFMAFRNDCRKPGQVLI
jgi:hypothetical protein